MSESKVRTVTLGEQGAVEVPAIEKQLAKLFVEAAGREAPAGVLRACALNLLIYTSDQVDAGLASRVVAEITPEHPSRALILHAIPEGAPALEARVLAHCSLVGAAAREVCCEEILLEGAGEATRGLVSAALQQISPELPVFLWWTGDPPFGSEDFTKLAAAADRLVVDSSRFVDPDEELRRESALRQNPGILGSLGDLNWTRLTPWRELTAEFFDRADYREHLARVDQVEIDYETGDPPNPIQALLFCGWLASRLGWHPEITAVSAGERDRRLTFRAGTRTITALLRGRAPMRGERGDLFSVSLVATQEPAARFTVGCGGAGGCVTARAEVTGESPTERTVPLALRTLGELLAEELEILGRDTVFERSLEFSVLGLG